ncbi:YrhB family protein [Shewanella corallii]|uniref:YrhB family protein n=1 Tax=Shewanella corallii TaxID=560080 RepID=A0ABT0N8U0_9GAMM|nr:YrhB domain-containing protein [Shewanella corallii]MCL2914281.1 YrhB family protein [Shewanella corallii]
MKEMITKDEAKSIVESHIATFPQPENDRYIVLDDSTISKEWGWVYFYTSEKWHTTGELQFAVAGNAPLIVEKHTGNLLVTGTAKSIEHYINEYEATGSPTA